MGISVAEKQIASVGMRKHNANVYAFCKAVDSVVSTLEDFDNPDIINAYMSVQKSWDFRGPSIRSIDDVDLYLKGINPSDLIYSVENHYLNIFADRYFFIEDNGMPRSFNILSDLYFYNAALRSIAYFAVENDNDFGSSEIAEILKEYHSFVNAD